MDFGVGLSRRSFTSAQNGDAMSALSLHRWCSPGTRFSHSFGCSVTASFSWTACFSFCCPFSFAFALSFGSLSMFLAFFARAFCFSFVSWATRWCSCLSLGLGCSRPLLIAISATNARCPASKTSGPPAARVCSSEYAVGSCTYHSTKLLNLPAPGSHMQQLECNCDTCIYMNQANRPDHCVWQSLHLFSYTVVVESEHGALGALIGEAAKLYLSIPQLRSPECC